MKRSQIHLLHAYPGPQLKLVQAMRVRTNPTQGSLHIHGRAHTNLPTTLPLVSVDGTMLLPQHCQLNTVVAAPARA